MSKDNRKRRKTTPSPLSIEFSNGAQASPRLDQATEMATRIDEMRSEIRGELEAFTREDECCVLKMKSPVGIFFAPVYPVPHLTLVLTQHEFDEYVEPIKKIVSGD